MNVRIKQNDILWSLLVILSYKYQIRSSRILLIFINPALKSAYPSILHNLMQELTLMYNWCRKMRDTFDLIAQSYEQYAKNKGIATYKSKNKKQSYKKKQKKIHSQKSESSSEETKPKALNLSTVLPPVPKNNKQSYEYGYRIAALRKLGQKAEEEMEINEQEDNKKAEIKKKNSAFFLFAREKRNIIKEEYPQLDTRQIAKILAEVWKNMSDSQKNAYENQNKNIRTDFQRKFKRYLQGILKLHSKRSREGNQEQTEQR